MSAAIDLLEIEKKAYRDSQQDGLMEVMMGLILITFGCFHRGISIPWRSGNIHLIPAKISATSRGGT
jgi:hypothetical protein